MNLFQLLFGCKHNWSRPYTPVNKHSLKAKSRTYKVCLRCGEERYYNWQTMQIEEERKVTVPSSLSGEKLLKELEGENNVERESSYQIL